uniref:Uncharacterized protein n=1 Tax=Soybean thrips virga-like virus 1 TaxID=2802949 RepID=A0A7T8G264_9VIRU|nr:hypothetical protein 2 [Soybean thrips virga-like virus 1]
MANRQVRRGVRRSLDFFGDLFRSFGNLFTTPLGILFLLFLIFYLYSIFVEGATHPITHVISIIDKQIAKTPKISPFEASLLGIIKKICEFIKAHETRVIPIIFIVIIATLKPRTINIVVCIIFSIILIAFDLELNETLIIITVYWIFLNCSNTSNRLLAVLIIVTTVVYFITKKP